ncbi:hypothetical protein ACHAPA_011634 [Fusarium lateritium]
MDNSSITSAEDLPPQPGRTLLPSPVAQAVSLATRSTCLAIRLSTKAGSFGLSAAKVTTLSSLELARSMVETVLGQAGRETLSRSQSDMSTAEAESIIERSFEHLHHAMSQAVFWTSAGFNLTSTTFSMASGISQILLSSLDQIFGSTDSSRAIAGIITLIRREFHDPATGLHGDTIGVTDLVLGLCALAYLQRYSWKMIEEERQRQECEEIIWDVVVLNDGERVDIQDRIPRSPVFTRSSSSTSSSSSRNSSTDKLQTAVVNHSPPASFEEEESVIDQLKNEMARKLPPDTSVSISNVVSSTQTVTIDVDGPHPFPLPLLPGAEIVETTGLGTQVSKRSSQILNDCPEASSYRIVYKLERSRTGETSFQGSHDTTASVIDVSKEDSAPEIPAKEPPPLPRRPGTTGIKPPPPQRSRPSHSTNDLPSRVSSQATAKPRSSVVRDEKNKFTRRNSTSPPSSPVEPQTPQREANQKRPRAPVTSSHTRNKSNGLRENVTPPKKVLSKKK